MLFRSQVTNFVVKVRIDPTSYADLMRNGRPPFRPGMSASVDIHTKSVSDALSVPIQAVTTRDEDADLKKAKAVAVTDGTQPKEKKSVAQAVREVVFVVMGDTVKMVDVKTAIQDNQHIQIISGLNGDEEVISAPFNLIARKLKSGMKIQKVSEK